MPTDFNPLALLNYAKWAVLAYALFYVLMAFGLSLLGARVRQRSTWLAWIPGLNYWLMCRLAGASPLLILPALIPVLNFLVFAYLGAGMAKRVGRSGLLGALFGVPVLGNFVPLLLGTGERTAAEQAEPPPARPPLVTALIHAGVVCSLAALTATGFVVASRMSPAVAPTVQQATAALPERMTGTLTEFPIDTATDHPARPTQVMTMSFAPPVENDPPSNSGVAAEALPPWIASSALPALAESATSAEYVTDNAAAKVNVVTLALRANNHGDLALPTKEQLAAIAPDATVTGLELKTPENVTYRGFRVSTALAVYYALRRGDTNTAILISAQEAAGMAVAERLARNVGNGQGLLEEEQYRGSFGQLPAAPAGCTLLMVKTITEADIAAAIRKMDAQAAAKDTDPMAAQIVPLAKAVMPRSVTIAGYAVDGNPKQGYLAGVAGYASSSNAWTAVQALRAMQAFVPPGLAVSVKSIDVGGTTAFAVEAVDEEKPFAAVLLRQGPAIAVLMGYSETAGGVRAWAENYVREK